MVINVEDQIKTELNPGDVIMFVDGLNIIIILGVDHISVSYSNSGDVISKDTLYKVKTLSKRSRNQNFVERTETYAESYILRSIRSGNSLIFKGDLEKSILAYAGFDV